MDLFERLLSCVIGYFGFAVNINVGLPPKNPCNLKKAIQMLDFHMKILDINVELP